MKAGQPEPLHLAEVLGLYGPVRISELLVQKIWLRRDFGPGALSTLDGRPLRVIRPGRWNRLGGPDFLGAEIELEGRRLLGDVEIHFYAEDWRRHGHDLNPAFNGVVLHVVVFDPAGAVPPARTAAGRELPVLVLAPLLREGLEEYAVRDALQALERTDPLELAAPLLELPLAERRERMRAAARVRWHQKRLLAARRLEAARDWAEACHQTVLEALGARRNRGPMAELALRYPLVSWTDPSPAWTNRLYNEQEGHWRVQGCRPANHPRRRLEQYGRVVDACPDWPGRLSERLARLPGGGDPAESTAAFRRRLKLAPWRRGLCEAVFGGAIPNPRADTIVADGLLPLAAALGETDALEATWFHWWPGDLPESLRQFLRTAGLVTSSFPSSNGLQQAALQWLIERE